MNEPDLLLALRYCEEAAFSGQDADTAIHHATRHFSVDACELRKIWLQKIVAHEQHLQKKLRRERNSTTTDATR